MKSSHITASSLLLQRVLALILVIAFVGVHIGHQHFQHTCCALETQISQLDQPWQQAEAIGHSSAAKACPVCSLLAHLALAKQNAGSYQTPQDLPSQCKVGPGWHRPCQIIASLPSPRAPPASLA